MKKKIKVLAIIALVAVIGFSMAACDDGSTNPTTYTVTVNDGSGSGSYEAGSTVTIKATVPSGKSFVNWTVNSGGATLANANNQSTTFTMPSNAVTVTANFSDGSSPNTSLDGVWVSGGIKVTVNGNSGILTEMTNTEALWQSAITKGFVTVGSSQCWRNLTSTGTSGLTWSGQELGVTYNTLSPNVATGTGWINATFTMSSNGQTLTVVKTTGTTTTYTRQNSFSLDGVWVSGGIKVTVNSNSGILTEMTNTEALWQSAITKGFVTVGSSQCWRNLTSTGTSGLTWSGQELGVTYNTLSPNVATGTGWIDATFTMSSNGQTLTVVKTTGTTTTYTRQQ